MSYTTHSLFAAMIDCRKAHVILPQDTEHSMGDQDFSRLFEDSPPRLPELSGAHFTRAAGSLMDAVSCAQFASYAMKQHISRHTSGSVQ